MVFTFRKLALQYLDGLWTSNMVCSQSLKLKVDTHRSKLSPSPTTPYKERLWSLHFKITCRSLAPLWDRLWTLQLQILQPHSQIQRWTPWNCVVANFYWFVNATKKVGILCHRWRGNKMQIIFLVSSVAKNFEREEILALADTSAWLFVHCPTTLKHISWNCTFLRSLQYICERRYLLHD